MQCRWYSVPEIPTLVVGGVSPDKRLEFGVQNRLKRAKLESRTSYEALVGRAKEWPTCLRDLSKLANRERSKGNDKF